MNLFIRAILRIISFVERSNVTEKEPICFTSLKYSYHCIYKLAFIICISTKGISRKSTQNGINNL